MKNPNSLHPTMGSPAPESELGPTASLYDPPRWHKLELVRLPSTSAEPPPGFSAEPPGELLPSSFPHLSPSADAYSPAPSPPFPTPGGRIPEAIIGIGAVAGIVVGGVVLVIALLGIIGIKTSEVIVIGGLILIISLLGVWFYINKKYKRAPRNRSENDLSPGPPAGGQHVPPPTANRPPLSRHNPIANLTTKFTYEELKMATDNFSESNFLGQGGFGKVHKGRLPNGTVVAIKQLKPGSEQGEREFKAEVVTISRVHHRHLVSLVGYCRSEEHRLLVYEFVPNKTLTFHLHEQGRPVMSWRNRMKIALGSATGLAYLHEDCQPRIIHRDIKAANILIDDSFEAKVADFGLARFFSETKTQIITQIMGTSGYMAPEYEQFGKLTKKSDTFSFGVMLLELITGRRPIHENKKLVNWARPLLSQALKDGNFIAFVDPNLEYDSSEMKRMVVCAAACVRMEDKHRPSMIQIARALEGIIPLEDLNEGVIPGRCKDDRSGEHGSSAFLTAGDQTLSGPNTEDLPTT